jgi:hypothetical protein
MSFAPQAGLFFIPLNQSSDGLLFELAVGALTGAPTGSAKLPQTLAVITSVAIISELMLIPHLDHEPPGSRVCDRHARRRRGPLQLPRREHCVSNIVEAVAWLVVHQHDKWAGGEPRRGWRRWWSRRLWRCLGAPRTVTIFEFHSRDPSPLPMLIKGRRRRDDKRKRRFRDIYSQ